MMMFSIKRAVCLLVFLYFVQLNCKGQGEFGPASKCASVECPLYDVVHTEKEFEIRSYREAMWVSGPTTLDTSYLTAFPNATLSLDAYFGGQNVEKVKIDPTAPIFVDILPGLNYVENTTYTAYYYVPQKYQKSVPTPLSPQLKPVTLPKHKYSVVKRFKHYLLDDTIFLGLNDLENSLKGTPYERLATFNQFTVVSYNLTLEDFSTGFTELLVWFD